MQPVAEYVEHALSGTAGRAVPRCTGYRLEGWPGGVHTGMPSPLLTVVLSLAEPTRVAWRPGAGRAAAAFSALTAGLHTGPTEIAHDGCQFGVQLAVDPRWSRPLFGAPAGELAGVVVHLADLVGDRAAELTERLHAASGWAKRFALVEQAVRQRLSATGTERGGVPAELDLAWSRLVGSRCPPVVSEVAREVGWSRRHLSARMQAEFGVAPSTAGRLARFDRSYRLLRARPASVAAVAAACGYYDQAHLNRDWREFAGHAPGRWRAQETLPSPSPGQVPSVQDNQAVPAAS